MGYLGYLRTELVDCGPLKWAVAIAGLCVPVCRPPHGLRTCLQAGCGPVHTHVGVHTHACARIHGRA